MRKILVLFALLGTVAACQPQATQTTAAAVAPAASGAIRPAAIAKPVPPLPVLFAPTDALTPPMRVLLRNYDLAELWRGDNPKQRQTQALEGFFGPDHYRFTLVITEAYRDAQTPAIYHVRGKCRYRKNIRPFVGTLTVRELGNAEAFYSPADGSFIAPRADSVSAEAWQANYDKVLSRITCYSLRAQVQLVEEKAENSGLFEGEAFLNFYVSPPHGIGYASAPALTDGEPARGSGLLLRGARRNVSTQQVKYFVVADDVFAAAPEVYKDFGIGDRGGQINPRYAKLGWNTYWENDEWWADSPRPSLNF